MLALLLACLLCDDPPRSFVRDDKPRDTVRRVHDDGRALAARSSATTASVLPDHRDSSKR